MFRAVWVLGTAYAVVIVLILCDWFPVPIENPSLRYALWGVGVFAVVLVGVRWYVATGPAVPCVPKGRVSEGQLERVLAWLLAYPLFPLQIVLFWAISWLGFGSGLGLPDLLWDDSWLWTFLNGLAVALLFSNILVVRYLLDQRAGAAPPPTWPWGTRGARPSLFCRPGTDPEVRELGTFLLVWWVPALAIFYGCKWFSPERSEFQHAAMVLGLVAGGFVLVAFVRTAEWWVERQTGAAAAGAAATSGAAVGSPIVDEATACAPPPAPPHLDILARVLFAVPAAILFGVLLPANLFGAIWHPVWVICLMLGVFNSLYGVVVFRFANLQYIIAILCVLVGIVCNTQNPDKMSFPNLDRSTLGLAPNTDVDLDALDSPANTEKVKALGLISTPELLSNFHTRWEQHCGGTTPDPARKPKLVIVACSGGGIRAAVWTAVVLEGLEEHPDLKPVGFRNHIRLITGASGGMLGAGLYVADFENFSPGIPSRKTPLSGQLARDSLWPTVQTMLLHDLPSIAVPWDLHGDRGRTLENAWVENTRPEPVGVLARPVTEFDKGTRPRSPLEKTFADLKQWEDEKHVKHSELMCDRPSIVFSPMMVEDCRRLLITNLDLGDPFLRCVALNGALQKRSTDPAVPVDVPTDQQSQPVLEFWRAFPSSYNSFQIKTAARMSATFPFIGPGVSLPTSPRRRVVDAGYFDNFGINLAAVWLHRYQEEIRAHTSGVVIIEIRAYPRRKEKLAFNPDRLTSTDSQTPNPKKRPELFTWALSEVSTPAEAIINLYSRGAYFRNDVQLDILDLVFNGPRDKRDSTQTPFLTTVTFECDLDAALSWTLPERDYIEIQKSFGRYQTEVKNLVAWFGSGGTGARPPAKGKP
jgi:hypothetical protein